MKVKTLNSFLLIVLLVLGVIVCYSEYLWADSFAAPTFEPVNSKISLNYVYTTEDGDNIQSVYSLAWYHKQFKKTKAIFYDESTGNWANISDEYYAEYYAQMPSSRYGGWYRHCVIVWIILLFVVTIAALYFVGLPICDGILYLKIRKNPNFEDCSYYLFGDRKRSYSDKVRSFLPTVASDYIDSKMNELQRIYDPSLVQLVYKMLRMVTLSENTKIPFFLKVIDNMTDQRSFLESEIRYWESLIGINPNAENYIGGCRNALNKEYYDIPKDILSVRNMKYHVQRQLEELFSKIMGSEVFKFEAFWGILLMPIPIEVDLIALNTTMCYTVRERSGYFPGISFKFEIYKCDGGNRQRLWSVYLPSVCNYTFEIGDFSEEVMYRTSINQTLSNFMDVVFKKK